MNLVFPLVKHTALASGSPKMPGEPPRVQPSKMNAANWESAGG